MANLQPPTELNAALVSMRRAMVYAFLFSFAINLLSLLMPIYSLQVFDRVMTSRSIDTLIGLSIVVLIGYVFFGALYATRAAVIARIVEWLEHQMAPKLLEMSIGAASETPMLSTAQPLRELSVVKNFIAGSTPTLMDIPFSAIFVLVIYMINPILGFITLIGIIIMCVAALINEYTTRKPLTRATEKQTESMIQADMLGTQAQTIQAMGMMHAVLKRWRSHNEQGLAIQELAQQRSAIVQAASRSLRLILQILITGIGAVLALEQQMSMGGLVAASILVARAMSPFEGIIMVWKQLIGTRDAYHRMQHLMRHAPGKRGDTALPAPTGALTVEGLYYSPTKTTPILRGIAFALQPGESLGIIGPSAAGKSTLAKCLVGIYPPSHGAVRLDGADVYHWARQDFGQYVGYLPQTVELFPGTIKENIARMNENVDDAAVVAAAQKAGVHELILALPQAYDTKYVTGQATLSPGQKQRIGLARALYGNVRFVVLDEPNSNLDGDGERALMQTLQVLKQARITAVVVAHRPSILQTVDKVMMVRAGTIEAFGPRDEVMSRYSAAGRAKLQPAQGGTDGTSS
jgi:PrtD family type I secretion system ABC transporter